MCLGVYLHLSIRLSTAKFKLTFIMQLHYWLHKCMTMRRSMRTTFLIILLLTMSGHSITCMLLTIWNVINYYRRDDVCLQFLVRIWLFVFEVTRVRLTCHLNGDVNYSLLSWRDHRCLCCCHCRRCRRPCSCCCCCCYRRRCLVFSWTYFV